MRHNLGTVVNKGVFLIILIVIIAVGVMVLPTYNIWRDTGKSLCVIEQFSNLRSLENVVNRVKERGGFDPDFRFKVMSCVDCIWFNTSNSQLMIRTRNDETPISFPVETNFQGIGCDCNDCNQEGDFNSDGVNEKCANLRRDTTYVFEILEENVNLIGYVDIDGNVQLDPPLSSKPCTSCVGYNAVCGDVGSEVIPCCFGTQCKGHPGGLWEVNSLGEEVGISAVAFWDDEKCLKSLREECNDYTECSIFKTYDENSAQYPCSTTGDNPTNLCCSPLSSKKQTGEGSKEQPASYCSGYGGCSVYCGDVKCGYVYNSTNYRFTDICCKPLGEKCSYKIGSWQCCAQELYDDLYGLPSQCLEDDGDPCLEDSTDCKCCITPGYECTYETRDLCCKPSSCKTITNDPCGGGSQCWCINPLP